MCGDGLTPRAVVQLRRLGIDTDDPRFERHQGLRIHSRRVTLELPWPDLEVFPNFGLMMTRAEFDELLARHAEKAGARLLERTEAVGPIREDGWVTGATIKGEDGEEQDGPRAVRDRRGRRLVALRVAGRRAARPVEAARDRRTTLLPRRAPPRAVARGLDGPARGRGHDPAGLRMAVPARRRLDQRGGGTPEHVPRLQGPVGPAGVRRVLADAAGRVERQRDLGRGPGAVGAAADGLLADAAGDPGMLVVGDAAGLVNPFNGEGIAYAMEAGELAGS